MTWNIINGNSAEILKTYPDNSFDAVITDPPYGIDFLGKSWDSNTGDIEVYQQCFRVLKPGGHLLAFSAARTYHHLAMNVERCGFEIRDQLMWIYGSGFPKSQNVGKMIDSQILTGKAHTSSQRKMTMGNDYTPAGHYTIFAADQESQLANESKDTKTSANWIPKTDLGAQYSGWGTSLKPAHEPIVMARKPITEKNIAMNVQVYGTGAINIDATRVPYESDYDLKHQEDIRRGQENAANGTNFFGTGTSQVDDITLQGRFPANVLGEIEEPYQKYFYCPKVSGKERHIGMVNPGAIFGSNRMESMAGDPTQKLKNATNVEGTNNHPTVKPIELMKYLIKLVTPSNGHILDPFNGSGSTGCAAVELGFDYTGIELDPNYVDIATKRISHWEEQCKPKTTYNNLFEEH